MTLNLITAPTTEPLTVADVKTWAGLPDVADFDQALEQLISACREQAEGALGLAYLTQTWDQIMDGFPVADSRNPYAAIRLLKRPIQSITSITYTDTNGNPQTVLSADYTLDAYSKPARIVPAYGMSWPATRAMPQVVTVRFVAGWASVAAAPVTLLQALAVRVGTLYEHREMVDTDEWRDLPFTVRALESNERLFP